VTDEDSTATVTVARAAEGNASRLRVVTYRVVSGPDAGASGSWSSGRGFVGRASSADLRLADPTVSQFHVEVSGDDGGITLRDLGSHNGTRIGEVVIERGLAPSGAVLTLGATQVSFSCAGVATVERSKASGFGSLVGASASMRDVYAMLDRLARSSIPVLVEGATGTGKELAARALHEEGPRARGPFVAVSCAAIPPGLVEATLFGQEGGDAAQPGLFERADGGTLLLDEVAELPLVVQAKLLRVVEQQEVLRVGATTPRRIDARVVATTRQDLRQQVNRGAFREDLYFRIAQARVRMPSLDERWEDKKPLAQHFLSAAASAQAGARAFASDALEALVSRRFPGNVRELKSTVERALLVAEGATISLADLAFERALAGEGPAASDSAQMPIESFKDAKRTVVDDFERAYLKRLLVRAGDNVSRAAALAGIERQSLRALLKRHGLREDDEAR
jgi:DNA-binding NtrC family response regulator